MVCGQLLTVLIFFACNLMNIVSISQIRFSVVTVKRNYGNGKE